MIEVEQARSSCSRAGESVVRLLVHSQHVVGNTGTPSMTTTTEALTASSPVPTSLVSYLFPPAALSSSCFLFFPWFQLGIAVGHLFYFLEFVYPEVAAIRGWKWKQVCMYHMQCFLIYSGCATSTYTTIGVIGRDVLSSHLLVLFGPLRSCACLYRFSVGSKGAVVLPARWLRLCRPLRRKPLRLARVDCFDGT